MEDWRIDSSFYGLLHNQRLPSLTTPRSVVLRNQRLPSLMMPRVVVLRNQRLPLLSDRLRCRCHCRIYHGIQKKR